MGGFAVLGVADDGDRVLDDGLGVLGKLDRVELILRCVVVGDVDRPASASPDATFPTTPLTSSSLTTLPRTSVAPMFSSTVRV